ncbi:MAG: hypothetical protein IT443_02700 [Phycisphaeraceae bacterium]|nr:hypothetical protein [Phycisphaeraceae bacterium]
MADNGFRLIRNDFESVKLHGFRQTLYFSHEGGQLCQWVELDLEVAYARPYLDIELRSGKQSAVKKWGSLVGTRGIQTVRAFAPARWPKPADPKARLILRSGEQSLEAEVAIGDHRPWTIYLLTDICVDDTWAFSDLEAHNREDYLTTLSELNVSSDNCYNFAAAHQAEHYFDRCTKPQGEMLKKALRSGRFYMTPTPNQLNCAQFLLSAYPMVLEPFLKWCRHAGMTDAQIPADAYHMEAPTWTNGYVNLLSAAGFRSFGKSLLQYQAPWVTDLKKVPRLTRLEVSPGRFVYLLLGCGIYSEGEMLLHGLPQANVFLHEKAIPKHEVWGPEYPTSALPLIGIYSDLAHHTKDWGQLKVDTIDRYNNQGWEYPRLVSATWPHYFDHVQREIGPPAQPQRGTRLRTVRGDTGSSWDMWPLDAQHQSAGFRQAQRDVVSLRTLLAMIRKPLPEIAKRLDLAAWDLVALGDHAWNGSGPNSKRLNYSIRHDRVERIQKQVAAIRKSLAKPARAGSAMKCAVVNTLGWTRRCRIQLPKLGGKKPVHLVDPETRETFAVVGKAGDYSASIPHVPAFGARVLEFRPGAATPKRVERVSPLDLDGMGPMLDVVDARPISPRNYVSLPGGKRRWRLGPFSVTVATAPLPDDDGIELLIDVKGTPPREGYNLSWTMTMPWNRCVWRGESGGGFATPGPSDKGGDSLLGVAGSAFVAGEGLSVCNAGRTQGLDMALDQSGACRFGNLLEAGAGRHDPKPFRSVVTDNRFQWHLMGTGQNPKEALEDQGGHRAWRFRCAIRTRRGGFDDAQAYRFAAGFNRLGEVVDPALMRWTGKSWLTVAPDRRVLVLNATVRDGHTSVDFYNTAKSAQTITLSGPAVTGRALHRADLLGRVLGPCARRSLTIAPMTFARVRIE